MLNLGEENIELPVLLIRNTYIVLIGISNKTLKIYNVGLYPLQ